MNEEPASRLSGSPRRGRQLEAARNDARVLDAAREVFADAGWSAPVALVAQMAGVGMGSLYRRYGSKEDLLRHLCLTSLEQMTDAVDLALGEFKSSQWSRFEAFVRTCVSHRAGAFGVIAGHLPPDSEMSRAAEQVHSKVEQLVKRTQREGTLRVDVTAVDIFQILEMMSRVGSRTKKAHAARDLGEVTRPELDRRLTVFLCGLRSEASLISLSQPPSWLEYRSRWERVSPVQSTKAPERLQK